MVSAAELRELDYEELETRLDEYRRELFNLRFQLATGQLDNTARLGEVKRDVARVLTLLRDYEIALAEGRTIEPAPHVERPPRRRAERAREEALLAEEVDAGIEEAVEEGLPEDDDLVEAEVLEAEDEAESLGTLPEDEEGQEDAAVEAAPEPVAEEKRPRVRRRRSRAKAAEDDDAEAEAAGGEEQ